MNIFCGNLSFQTTEETLRKAFEAFGEVKSAKIIYHFETDRSRGFGFVEMPNREAALKAIAELDGAELDGRLIHLEEARPALKRDRAFVKTPENAKWR